MKFLKHFALAALAVGGLLVPLATTHPQPASAKGCGVFVDIVSFGLADCTPFGSYPSNPEPSFSCSLDGANVSGTLNLYSYKYDLQCLSNNKNIPTIHVNGTYAFDTSSVHEELKNDTFELKADWRCAEDPWGPSSATRAQRICSSQTLSISGRDNGEFDLSHQTQPFSAQYLGDDQLRFLNQQLTTALAHPAAPAPVRVIGASTTTIECALCSVLSTTPAPAPAPTLPDLKVPSVGGDAQLAQGVSSVYSVGVSNLGTRPQTQVQVAIQVTGALEYVGMAQTPAGWDCSGTAPIACVGPLGGSGDPVQNLAVNFQVRVRGAKAGVGAISASVDPNDLIHESDETNNAKTLAVTVR